MPPSVPSTSGRTSQAPWNNPATAAPPADGGLPVVVTRPLDGALTGLAAATLGGVLWWAASVAVFTSQPAFEWWPLGSVLVGLVTGIGVLLGTRRGGLVSGLLALVFSSAAVLAAVYFIDRSHAIIALEDAGRPADIPLWQGFRHVADVYRGWWDLDREHALMWLAGPVVAVLIAGWPNRRPIGA